MGEREETRGQEARVWGYASRNSVTARTAFYGGILIASEP